MHFLFVWARFVLSWRCTLIAVVGALRPNCELIVVPVRNTSLNLIEHIGKREKKVNASLFWACQECTIAASNVLSTLELLSPHTFCP